ncbi:T9SS type A sorting domain-containing protein [Panacibacter sp. DH6]|uniref:T9SS type A sorting domain-containing protein n=1 Tax=Panacibacter microcysteis TaxID=2793269 RepID=A0A931GXM7_9BACT|nr:T9SS type A sorting domain-containing protein [Panacibacter microcysteis]MBG9376124.1 T9SS type A sorting domain-containing protein [Panacibacter microcysteis]
MKKLALIPYTFSAFFLFVPGALMAQTASPFYNYGVWQTFGDPVDVKTYPQVKGRLCNVNWKDIETANNVWVWDSLDIELRDKVKDSLPVIFMVYTEQGAPEWLYQSGVPKVAQNSNGIITYTPFYANAKYKSFFKRMITTVRQHIETLSPDVRKWVVGVQGCFGSTGDYIAYKGAVEARYQLTDQQFFDLFKEFSLHYYNEYLNTNPKVYLLSNPQNNGQDQMEWLIQNCPNGWVKCGSLGKGFQLNDEVSKSKWLYDLLNKPQNGEYLRSRSEVQFNPEDNGWWREFKYRNMFALMTYCVFWGLDWTNQAPNQLFDKQYDLAFDYYNRYAGQKNPALATNAMCALRDGLNAADTIRFPVSIYGKADRADTMRYKNIAEKFARAGARQEDALTATMSEFNNLLAKGINDVGWDVFAGNYERYLYQIKANETSTGYWNITAPADSNAIYGKFARGISTSGTRNAMYFDVDSAFLNYAPVNGRYPVSIDLIYLDVGAGGFRLNYDARTAANKASVTVNLTNTGVWKKTSVTLYDAYFGNRATNNSDFYIQALNGQNVLFSMVELSRPDSLNPRVGLFAKGPVLFDSACIKSSGNIQSFQLEGYFLNGQQVKISPLAGYTFSASLDSSFRDSLFIGSYGTGFNKTIYIKFNPQKAGQYNGSVVIAGGGAKAIALVVRGTGANSRPMVSSSVINVSCNGAKNGNINLTLNGGAGPFLFNWTSDISPLYKAATEDISSLSPGNYAVTITSAGGCTSGYNYSITEPAVLSTTIRKDSDIVCRGGITTVTVTASGGVAPYAGTGIFTVLSSNVSYTITDANGCQAETEKITIPPGTLTPPAKPESVIGNDARGLCNTSSFYTIATVPTATSYNWILPQGTVLKKINAHMDSITIAPQAGFTEGVLYVSAVNACGSSVPTSRNVTALPANPAGITGPTSALPNQAGLVYRVVTPLPGLTYAWTSSTGTKLTVSTNTLQATVTWGITDGKVNVKANNACGTSGPASLDVKLSAVIAAMPAASGVTTQQNAETKIFPNPAHDYVNVLLDDNATCEVSLCTAEGAVISTTKVEKTYNNQVCTISLQGLPAGVYVLLIRNKLSKNLVVNKIIRH